MKAFPIAWVTTGKTLLIIGGSWETEARLRHAVRFEWLKIRLVAAKVPDELRGIAGGDERVEFFQGAVGEEDVAACDMVIEDSGDRATAEKVRAWCEKYHRPLNAVDKPDLCDFYYMSLVFKDPLLLSITSGGDAPAIASALRRWLEEKIGPGWASAAKMLSETRKTLPGGRARVDLLRKIARHPCFLELVEVNNTDGMRSFIEHELRGM